MELGETSFEGEDSLDYYATSSYRNARAEYELKTDMGIVTLFVGIGIFLISIFPVIKKQKLALIGSVGGVAAIMVGLAYGTHMFS